MTSTTTPPFPLLTPQQIDTFVQDGLLVVDNFLRPDQVAVAHDGLAASLARHGVDVNDLERTGHHLAALSSTGGSGGVLDLFYDEWKVNETIALNPQLLAWTQQLWKAAYYYSEEDGSAIEGQRKAKAMEDLPAHEQFKWHPYGPFDPDHGGYAYIDRFCYRIPTALSDTIGPQQQSSSSDAKSSKKNKTLQRSLTPHLDCCPDTFATAAGKTKWRPIQCFISLTDNLEPNTGGFEAVKGFHREFHTWTQNRAPTVVVHDKQTGQTKSIPAPCIGEYTHIRPTQDAAVMQRVQHIPVRAGSVVFWDNRLPHANAYRHTGAIPRVVVYASFLPNIPLNRAYAVRQWQQWLQGRTPNDQWISNTAENDKKGPTEQAEESAKIEKRFKHLPKLSRQLLALEEWE
eukprot:scaffold6596_cov161-Amphora_coffeaeformis.AAC.19